MDYNEYNKIQSDLGAVADSFKSDVLHLINLSNADEETKELITDISNKVETSLLELSILVSRVARLMVSK